MSANAPAVSVAFFCEPIMPEGLRVEVIYLKARVMDKRLPVGWIRAQEQALDAC